RELQRRVAFVGMAAALHGHDGPARQPAADQLALVRRRLRRRKVRNVAVRDRGLALDLLDQPAEPRAQDDTDLRRPLPARPHRLRRLPDLLVQVGHAALFAGLARTTGPPSGPSCISYGAFPGPSS